MAAGKKAGGERRRGGRRTKRSGDVAETVATAANEASFVEDPTAAAGNLRRGLAGIFKQHAKLCSRRFGTAAPVLAVDGSFTSEQIWGQLAVLYAPVLKAAEASITRMSAPADEQADAVSASKARRAAKAAAPRSLSGDFDSAASDAESEGLVSSDDEQTRRLANKLRRNRGGGAKGKAGGAGADPDAWRYALGRPGEVDEDFDEDDDDAAAAAAQDAEKDGVDDFAGSDEGDDSAFDAAEGDDVEDAFEDFDDEDDEEGLGGEEADGDDEDDMLGDLDDGDVSSDAAMRELYGDDAAGMDSDEEDEEDGVFDEDMGEFIEGREAEEAEEAEYDDEDGGDDDGANASPFGPAAGPENPLDFTDIDNDPSLTAFEKEEKKRLRQTQEMELQRVHGKHWSMMGEVAAAARPRDSLIDESLDFDHALAPAPVITEFFTSKLEDRIKKRVADGNFDDVVRKVMQTTPADLEASKRDEALDAQKSKLSLMDLYEKEFLEKQAAAERAEGAAETAEPLTEIERDELKAVQMWKRLGQHLDALSNFFFTPKPVNPEVEARVRAVDSQAPAITLEAVGMAALSGQQALAPQDVFRPKRGMHSDAANSELKPQERRAIRRAAKSNAKASTDRKEKQQAARKKEREARGAGKAKASA